MAADGDAPVEGFDNGYFAVVGLRVTAVVGAEAAGAGNFVALDAGLLKQRWRMLCFAGYFGCCPGSGCRLKVLLSLKFTLSLKVTTDLLS